MLHLQKGKESPPERKGISPVLLGDLWREAVWHFGQTVWAVHLPQGDTGSDAAQAEHMVAGQADRVLRISQADGAWLNPEPKIQEGRSVSKQRH